MSVKIEVVRSEPSACSAWPRPWRVEFVNHRWAVKCANGNVVQGWPDAAEARAIVDAVNTIPPRKGKIEKFVVEMDPETFRVITAVMGLIAHEAGHDFWDQAREFVQFKSPRPVGESLQIGPRSLILDAIEGMTLKEDA